MDLYCSPGNRMGTTTGKVLVLNDSRHEELWQKTIPGRTLTQHNRVVYVQRPLKLHATRACKESLTFECANAPHGFRSIENVEFND